jgi:predicted PurR-regulated permease PerM
MLFVASVVIVVAGLRAASTIVVPFLSAVFLAVLCLPTIHWLRRKGVPEALQLTIVIGGIVALFFAFATFVSSSLSRFRTALPGYGRSLAGLRDNLATWLEEHGMKSPEDVFAGWFDPEALIRHAGSAAAQVGSLLGDAFLILLLLAFLLGETASLPAKLRAASRRPEESIARWDQVLQGITRYFAIKTWMSLATGISVAVLMVIIGVDFPVLWGFTAFMLNYVPNIGSVLAAIPPVLIALVQPGLGFGSALAVAIGFIVINIVFGSIVETRLAGRGLDLSTFVVLVSLLFWGWVLGPVGMLLSVPLTMAVKIALGAFDDTRGLAVMLSGEAGTSPSAGADSER